MLLALTVVHGFARVAHAPYFLFAHCVLGFSYHRLSFRCDQAAQVRSALRGLRDWSTFAIFLLFYFELNLLLPRPSPGHILWGDYLLQSVDVRLLGDPLGFVERFACAPLSELLTLCYWSYYFFPLIVPAALYKRGALDDFRVVLAITLVGYVFCFAGYVLLPAMGPHRLFDGPRSPAFDGYGLARHAYRLLASVRIEPPDAFPSGHAMMGALVPALAFRWLRPWFPWLLPIGAGMVLSTIYLRYHYLLDVVAALLLAPLAWMVGRALARSQQPATRRQPT